MLGVNESIKAKKTGNKFFISVPAISPANNPSTFAWVFKIENIL